MNGLERWKGKVALVTGASSGIGQAIGRALGGIGMKVAIVARRADRLETLAKEMQAGGADVLPLVADMGRDEDVLGLFPRIHQRWGTVDVLVNSAGTGRMSQFDAGTPEQWREILHVNVVGVTLCTREALKEMEEKEDAQIVNISSIYAHRGQVPNFSYYQGSKFALRAMTDTLRAELHARKSRIRVGMISPGLTATEFREKATDGKFTYQSYFKDFHPLLPEDIAQAVLYMLSTPRYVQVQDVLLSPMGQGL